MHKAMIVRMTVVGILLVVGVFLWWQWRAEQALLPDAIATVNGRIEATEYDIASKLAGRLLELLARMDSADLQDLMLLAPTTHFVKFAQAILYRGAGWTVVRPQFLALLAIDGLSFLIALARFRRAIGQTRI